MCHDHSTLAPPPVFVSDGGSDADKHRDGLRANQTTRLGGSTPFAHRDRGHAASDDVAAGREVDGGGGGNWTHVRRPLRKGIYRLSLPSLPHDSLWRAPEDTLAAAASPEISPFALGRRANGQPAGMTPDTANTGDSRADGLP